MNHLTSAVGVIEKPLLSSQTDPPKNKNSHKLFSETNIQTLALQPFFVLQQAQVTSGL